MTAKPPTISKFNHKPPQNPEDSALILVVDDDETIRMMLSQEMEQQGYRVIEACNGEQGLEAYTHFHPDIVLLDAMMPIMDGFTCCRQLMTLPGSDLTSIIMVTCLSDSASVEQAFAAGAMDYITKPIHWAVLKERIHRLLQASRAKLELQQQTEREQLIGRISDRIRQSLNLTEILNTAVAEVRQFLATDRVLIYRFNPDWSGTVIVESVADHWTSLLDIQIQDPCFTKTYLPRFYQRGRVQQVEDIYTAHLPACYIEFLAQFQVRSSLVVPLLPDKELWGLLIAHHCSGSRRWQPLQISMVERLATQLAIAIKQSTLFEQVQQLNADLEHQVQERTVQLQQALEFEATLKRVTDKVRDSLDESQILQTAVQELAVVLGVSGCNAAIYDLSQGISTIEYEHTANLPPSQGRVSQIAHFPELYGQLIQGQYFQFCSTLPNPVRGRVSLFACPIFDDQGVLGDLWLVNSATRSLSELEIRLVQQVANQCAIAIRQARLYHAAQTHIAELEKLNRLKDDFLSTVSHELRSPVSNMRMAIQMLEYLLNNDKQLSESVENAELKRSKVTTYLQILHSECVREINLINDLLDLQRLEAGHECLEITPIQLSTWIERISEPFHKRAQERQLSLEIYCSSNLPDFVSDATSLGRILAELLNNACKYTPPEETITISAEAENGKLQLSVANSGVEIPPHELPRIFDKFYRIPSSDAWKQGGTGLGLALVKKLVEHLGGSIGVESAAGQTCFRVELPLVS